MTVGSKEGSALEIIEKDGIVVGMVVRLDVGSNEGANDDNDGADEVSIEGCIICILDGLWDEKRLGS